MRELGIGDAIDVYFTEMWDRTYAFDKKAIDAKEALTRSIDGVEESVYAQVAQMRRDMGLPEPGGQPQPPKPRMAEQMSDLASLREQMGLSPVKPPGSA